jgi:hypothetical protein
LLQIIACNDEVGGFHFSDPDAFAAVIFAFADDRFATDILFKTAFAFAAAIRRQAMRAAQADCKYVSQWLASAIE